MRLLTTGTDTRKSNITKKSLNRAKSDTDTVNALITLGTVLSFIIVVLAIAAAALAIRAASTPAGTARPVRFEAEGHDWLRFGRSTVHDPDCACRFRTAGTDSVLTAPLPEIRKEDIVTDNRLGQIQLVPMIQNH